MPYIKQEDREPLLTFKRKPETSGELNFLISTLIDDYIGKKGLSYATINEVVGVLDCAKMEYYNRIAEAYELKKLTDNGEVYKHSIEKLTEAFSR